jgi:Photosynthesis system II assembly factor YCF48
MEKVPKIVTERLQAAAVTEPHPDADVLTAFSERNLPERERSGVLEHLARCSECRDVVALSLPPEEAAAVEIRPVRGRWLTWPRMRWGLASAGVVAIVLFAVVQLERKHKPQTVASFYDAQPSPVRNEAKTPTEPAAALQEPQAEAKKSASARADNESREFDRLNQFSKLEMSLEDKRVVSGGTVHGNSLQGRQLAHGPKGPNQYQQNQFVQNMNANTNTNTANGFNYDASAAAPASPPSPALYGRDVTKELALTPPTVSAPIGGPRNEKTKLDTLAVAGRPAASLQSSGSQAGAEIARAKPASTVNAPATQPQASEAFTVSGDVSNFSASGTLAPESARWSINATGGLQRSLDQGRTWQDVEVSLAPGMGSVTGLRKAMKSSRERAAMAKDKADMKQKPIVFRAVAANGPDVWAGGSDGNLYHSTDSGAHWLQILPTWRGIDLTGDIVNLQFADPQNGRIVTSSAEIWTTADGGQTWEKR